MSAPKHSGQTEPTLKTYVAYGYGILSQVPFPELEPAAIPPTIIVVARNEPLDSSRHSQRQLYDEDGRLWLVVSESFKKTALSFPGVADFAVDLGARRIEAYFHPASDPAVARHVLLDQVIPCLLCALGSTVVHASGVVVDGCAVLFAGPSGSGKSTLAARCASKGHQVLGDDAMLLTEKGHGWLVRPSYPGLRLWRDSMDLLDNVINPRPLSTAALKCRVDLPRSARPAQTSHALSAIVMIHRRPGSPQGRRLTGSEAFSRLWPIVFGWPSRGIDMALLDRIAWLANQAVVLGIGFADNVNVEEIMALVIDLSDSQ